MQIREEDALQGIGCALCRQLPQGPCVHAEKRPATHALSSEPLRTPREAGRASDAFLTAQAEFRAPTQCSQGVALCHLPWPLAQFCLGLPASHPGVFHACIFSTLDRAVTCAYLLSLDD